MTRAKLQSALSGEHYKKGVGVSESGKANPGPFNFFARFAEKTAELIAFEKWEN